MQRFSARWFRRNPVLILLLAVPFTAHAQTYTRYFAGTGFYVDRSGEIVTNAHVVENCADITLRNADGVRKAEMVAVDRAQDLAILRTDATPPHIAKLRAEPSRLRPGDRVQMIGYPNDHSVSGIPQVTESVVQSLYGPNKETYFLEFKAAAEHGNSGGPLIDDSGDVVGIVTAKIEGGSGDIAIALPALKAFLNQHQVHYQEDATMLYLYDQRLQELAEQYSVEVLCRQAK